jgi:hypothetical protein
VVCRVQKVLECANVKLSSVAANALGASGRAIPEHEFFTYTVDP